MQDRKIPSKNRQTVATALAAVMAGLQRRWTVFMARKTSHWGRRQKLIFLIAICLTLGGASVFLLAHTILAPATIIETSADLISPVLAQPPLMRPAPRPIITPADAALLRRFRKKVDSLSTTEEGRKQLQDFESRHPHLLDSLEEIEKTVLPTLNY